MPDGKLVEITVEHILPGTVLRQVSIPTLRDGGILPDMLAWQTAVSPQFADCVIVDLVPSKERGNPTVKIARPHMGVYMRDFCIQVEQFEIPMQRLLGPTSPFRTVMLDRGRPTNVCK